MSESAQIKSALVFILAGLIVEVFCVYRLEPLTFVVFALVSVPLVLVGIGIFVRMVWRALRRSRAL
jgi:hypothetical protein